MKYAFLVSQRQSDDFFFFLIIFFFSNYLKKLSKGAEIRWGVFKGAREGGFWVGRFKRGADLEHNRNGWVATFESLGT